jgi:DNA-directed RNA polymerase specialized sigma24 family protein
MGAAAQDHLSDEVVINVYKSLLRYWKGKGFRPAEAMDLAQKGVCKGIEWAQSWRREAKLQTFLITIGKNRGIDYLRKEGTQTRLKESVSDAVGLVYRKSQRRTPRAKSQ